MIIKNKKFYNNSFSSELLRKGKVSKTLENFRRVLNVKSVEDLQQQVYSAVLSRPSDSEYDVITLTQVSTKVVPRRIFWKRTKQKEVEIKVDKNPLLSTIQASGVPISNIKVIKAECDEVTEADWETFNIQAASGTLLEIEASGWRGAAYSPLILEMLQSYKLRKFR